ncbi:MAG: ATP-dependent DNA helicase [Thermofilaceae archaeon]|nr:ATP-dependent DNA helicase [Thermofilaceae archaeon]
MNIEEIWPYKVWRYGQFEIARRTYETIIRGEHLLINYPTGAGKTAAVLAGAIPASISEKVRIIFLVRTKTQFQAPLRELRLMTRRYALNAVFLRSKRDLCLIKGVRLLPYDEFIRFCSELTSNDLCPYYRAAKRAEIETTGILSFKEVFAKSVEVGACPYEVARASLRNSQIIVAAYNYIFDQDLRRTFLADACLKLEDAVLVIDEAHNIPYSLVNLLSRQISEKVVKAARREARRFLPEPYRSSLEEELSTLLAWFRRLRTLVAKNGGELEIEFSDIIAVAFDAIAMMEVVSLIERRLNHVSYLRSVVSFLSLLSEHRVGYSIVASMDEGELTLKHLCIHPAKEVSPVFAKAKSVILMSGTLPPRDYLVSMVGLEDERVNEVRFQMAWASNVYATVLSGISSRYLERSSAMYRSMGRIIDELYQNLKYGVALVVVPSYNMAKTLRAYLCSEPIFVEKETTKLNDVLAAVKGNEKLLIICAAWGKLVEGVELKLNNSSLVKLVVIAGLPVPQPSIINKKLAEMAKYRLGDSETAWRLVFMVPAAVKVAQAIGRGIRSELDKVAVAILDERALENPVKEYLEGIGYRLEMASTPSELVEKNRAFINQLIKS